MFEHRPRRPDWTCWECRNIWPCYRAHVELLSAYRYDLAQLRDVMESWWKDARQDLPDVHAGALYARFVGWTRDTEDTGGRVVGRASVPLPRRER